MEATERSRKAVQMHAQKHLLDNFHMHVAMIWLLSLAAGMMLNIGGVQSAHL
jgi:hypothetical protein